MRDLALSAMACFCLALKTEAQEEPLGVCPAAAQPLNAVLPKDATIPPQPVAVPDGMQVELRLAQPVRGMKRTIKGTTVYSKPGDIVRQVAADDVRVNGLVVISKGAVGPGDGDQSRSAAD